MSHKNSKLKRNSQPRAMPVETIITRYKSAQKNQLEEQQKRTKNVKATIKKKKVNKKPQKIITEPVVKMISMPDDPVIIPEEPEVEEVKEYYPEKLKRKQNCTKVFLAPKHTYKFVGDLKTSNKRKLSIPQKENNGQTKRKQHSSFPIKNEHDDTMNYSEMNVLDIIRIDDNESLDEEDLAEILTCPSPVWWEEPPSGYEEESISETTLKTIVANKLSNGVVNTKEIRKELNSLNKEREEKEIIKLNINVQKGDDKFIQRRSKLETVLTKIKTNKTNNTDEFKNEHNLSINNRSREEINISPDHTRHKNTSESDVLDGDHQEIMNFENIEIPIENGTEMCVKKFDCSITNDIGQCTKETKKMDKDQNKISKNTKLDISEVQTEPETGTTKLLPVKRLTIKRCNIKKIINPIITSQKQELMKTNGKKELLSFIKINPADLSLKKIDCNTNPEHISPKQPKKVKNNISKKVEDVLTLDMNNLHNNGQINNGTKTKKVDSKELVDIYKILTEKADRDEEKAVTKTELKSELNEKSNTQMNSYYKYCKNIIKNKKEIISPKVNETNNINSVCNPKNKSDLVPEKESVKYCLQWSSICEADICKYCINKTKGGICTCQSHLYSCENCGFICSSKEDLTDHANIKCLMQDL